MSGLKLSKKMLPVWREAAATFCLGWIAVSLVVLPLAGSVRAARNPVEPSPAGQQSWSVPLSEDEKVPQLLSRITFGPRPSDVEQVRQMGIEAFLDEQLHPERIDDTAVEARVAKLPTLSMSSEELAENFQEMKQEKRAERPGNRSLQNSSDASNRTPAPRDVNVPAPSVRPPMSEMQGPRRVIMELAQEEVLRAVYSKRQLQEVMVQFWMNHFNIFAPKGADKWLTTSFERDTIRPRAIGKFEDLLVATAKSPAMLFYLDNWMSATPNPAAKSKRKRGWGRRAPRVRPFGQGGWRRLGGGPPDDRSGLQRAQKPAGKLNRRGLNENYGRELMELHTLGVNGGYTQRDVIEVARCLTGWTIDRPQRGGEFKFDPNMHDFGKKVVLGHKIRSGHGMEDGLQVLHLLAKDPSTAHFISLKLCRRFVADDPPEALVERAKHTFLHTHGNLRAVLKTILTSPEFYSVAAYRAKVKSPLELVASSIRALDAQTDASVPLLQLIARMGQPMFQYQAPTGFPDRASTWINSSALLMRMNFALLLASNRIPGTQVDWRELGSGDDSTSSEKMLAKLNQQLLKGSLEDNTRKAVLKELAGGNQPVSKENAYAADNSHPRGNSGRDFRGFGAANGGVSNTSDAVSTVAAMVIASPEFQRR